MVYCEVMQESSPNPRRRLTLLGLVFAMAFGIMAGTGMFTFHYGEGLSYFSKDPAACANCHIMRPQYDSWQKASHHTAATCVDCHLPHGVISKYIAKAENGYWHSKGFTFQDFHEPIQIRDKNVKVLQENCLACHGDLVHEMAPGVARDVETASCIHCHDDVGHGPPTGLGGPLREAELNWSTP